MSLRWKEYVVSNPPYPKSESNTQSGRFSYKRGRVTDLSRKRSMLLVFWHPQRLVQSIVLHLHFGQNSPILQRGLSAIAELIVITYTILQLCSTVAKTEGEFARYAPNVSRPRSLQQRSAAVRSIHANSTEDTLTRSQQQQQQHQCDY